MSTPDGAPPIGSPALQPPPSEGNDGTSRASTPTLSSHPQTQLPKKAGILSIFDEKLYDEEKVQSAIRKNDVLKKAEQRIDANTWDVEAWLTLVNEARNEGLDVGRWAYERFLRRFPTSGRHWKLYIQREIQAENFGYVDRAFKVLFSNELLSVDLHRAYLQYMRDKRLPRETMRGAYEYVIAAVGQDGDASAIWHDYIDFIKSWPSTNQFEEGNRTAALRKVYQEAVTLPLDGVEQLWREWDQLENALNKILAKKLLNDKAQAYQYARQAVRERRARAEGLQRNALAVPFRGSLRERQQMDQWRALAEYEMGNPLRLDKKEAVERRVVYQYKQWLLCAANTPFVWYDYCAYVASVGGNASAEYEKALTALPGDQLIGFAWADYEETRKNLDKATMVYERLLAQDGIKDKTLVYVQYMKYKRRSEGLSEARKVFKRARADRDRINFQVFVSNALLEYHSDKKIDVAEKIFRFGLDNPKQSFAHNPAYALEYLDFLTHLTEDNNTRVLYERVLTSVPREAQQDLWARFLRFEADYGDLQAALSVEQRARDAARTPALPVCYAIHRYRYLDLVPVSQPELDYLGYSQCFPQGTASEAPTHASASDTPAMQGVIVPDVSQMVAFNPEEGFQGGAGNAPQAIKDIIKLLPTSQAFKGPYVNVVALLDFINGSDGVPVLAVSSDIIPGGGTGPGVKREHGPDSESEGEAESKTEAIPINTQPRGARPNLFQKRMQKQFKPS